MSDPFGDDSFSATPLDNGARASSAQPVPRDAPMSTTERSGSDASPSGALPMSASSGGEDGHDDAPSHHHERQRCDDPDGADWDDEGVGEYDRPAVSSTMVITGPASRVAFDALRVAYDSRGVTGIEAATNRFARGIVESVVAPMAATVNAAASSAHFAMESSPARTMPASASAHAASSLNVDQAAADGYGPSCFVDFMSRLTPLLDEVGIREARLRIRNLPKNRFARIVMERAVREKGVIAAQVLNTLTDDSLAKHSVRILQPSSAASLGTRVTWGRDIDARARLLHNVAPRGGAHIVAASLDQLQVRLRAQKVRHAEGDKATNPLSAFDTWFADVDSALGNAYASNPHRSGTVVLLTQTGDLGMSPTELQRLFGRIHEAIVAREQHRCSTNHCMVAAGNGVPEPPAVVAIVALSVEYGSRSLRGAASGEVALSDVKVVCSAVNTHDGPLAALGLDLIRDLRGSFVGDHGIELVRDTNDLVQMLDAIALDAAIRDTGNPHCLVSGGLLSVDGAFQVRGASGNGLTTSLQDVEAQLSIREPSTADRRSPALRRALGLLETWGTILLPPQSPLGPPPSPAATPVCVSPPLFYGVAGALIAHFYGQANERRQEGAAVSSTLSASTFSLGDVMQWTAPVLGRFVYAARYGSAEIVEKMTDDEVSAVVSADDVRLVVSLLEAHAVVTMVGQPGGAGPQLFLPAATPATVPGALPHLFAFLASRSSAGALSPEQSVRWISTNVDPAIVLSGLAAAFADATRRGPAQHVLVWRNALILGMDPADADDDDESFVATPQRTVIAAVDDTSTGSTQRLLAVITVTPAFAASPSADGEDPIASQMFGAVLEALAQLKVTHLHGLQYNEGVPCPACLRRCVPSADGGWVDGRPIAAAESIATVASQSASRGRTNTAASAMSVCAESEQVHVFTKEFIAAMLETSSAREGADDPTSQCPLCGADCRLRSVASRATKVLCGVSGGRRRGADAEIPSWAPRECQQLLVDIDALIQTPADDDHAFAVALHDFGPRLDSLAWTLVKLAAAERRGRPSVANTSWAVTDDKDEVDEFGEKVAHRSAAPTQRSPRQSTEDDWDLV